MRNDNVNLWFFYIFFHINTSTIQPSKKNDTDIPAHKVNLRLKKNKHVSTTVLEKRHQQERERQQEEERRRKEEEKKRKMVTIKLIHNNIKHIDHSKKKSLMISFLWVFDVNKRKKKTKAKGGVLFY